MKTIWKFLAFTAIVAAVASCSKNDDSGDAVPLIVSVSNSVTSVQMSYPDMSQIVSLGWMREGDVVILRILSGNGGYTLTPRTETIGGMNESGEFVETYYTISETDMESTIDGDKIIFERIGIPDVPRGSYILSDRKGKKVIIEVPSPDWIGGL